MYLSVSAPEYIHHIKNINISASGDQYCVCVYVWVGVGLGGGLALCQRQPERLFSSGGGVGARRGFFVRGPLLQSTLAIQPQPCQLAYG